MQVEFTRRMKFFRKSEENKSLMFGNDGFFLPSVYTATLFHRRMSHILKTSDLLLAMTCFPDDEKNLKIKVNFLKQIL